MAQVSTRYYVSETDIAELMKLGGFPRNFSDRFTRDYAGLKKDTSSIEQRISASELEIQIIITRLDDHDSYLADLDSRLGIAEADIADNTLRIGAAETAIDTNRDDFDAHVLDRTTHGALGNLVGTLDYPTAITGGAVLLAAAVADATYSTVAVTNTATAAGAGYVQATAATWVTLLDELKADVNQLVIDHNALLTQFNALLASERAAKQLAP